MYGPGVEKLKLDQRVFTTPGGKKLELAIASSNYHIEVTPADVGMYDRVIIQDLIKEIAQTQSVDVKAARQFKVVVLNEAHLLSKDAQHGLRRTMEKYMGNMRVILSSNSTRYVFSINESRIIGPIRSRCLLVRVPSPSTDEICTVLQSVAEMEQINLPDEFSNQIATKCKGNLRRGLLMFEAAKIQQYPFVTGQQVVNTDWEAFIGDVATIMVDEQSPSRLLVVRGKLYELISHCIPPDVVLKVYLK
jgi:replication factor C subunit 3/5